MGKYYAVANDKGNPKYESNPRKLRNYNLISLRKYFESKVYESSGDGVMSSRLLHHEKVDMTNSKIVLSDHVINEMNLSAHYPIHEIKNMFKPLKPILIFVESTEKQIRRAKDLASKRKVPKNDALHALIARDHKAILVTLDNHFKELEDITKPHNPKNLI